MEKGVLLFFRGGFTMSFEQSHENFINRHLSRRSGERRGRLERGHGHGEKLFLQNVWFPLKNNFDGLHPEYELVDWRGRSYFADFVYIPRHGQVKFVWEIKGYGVHVKELDRQGFASECKRELFLEGLGYRVVSFAYDDVKEQPELLIALLRLLLSLYEPAHLTDKLIFVESEMIRLSLTLGGTIRPKDAVNLLGMTSRRAVGILQQLSGQGWFRPETGTEGRRTVRYVLIRKLFA
jgi:DNA-binding MarR family transcriptional regulator